MSEFERMRWKVVEYAMERYGEELSVEDVTTYWTGTMMEYNRGLLWDGKRLYIVTYTRTDGKFAVVPYVPDTGA